MQKHNNVLVMTKQSTAPSLKLSKPPPQATTTTSHPTETTIKKNITNNKHPTNKKTDQTPKFPFQVIIVTTPSHSASDATNQDTSGPLQQIKSDLHKLYQPNQNNNNDNNIIITSTCDPYGVRCGSGGGTLSALDLADSLYNDNNNNKASPPPSVLIVHAGGESSRCPTQMSLGKSWTSLPISTTTTTTDNDNKVGNPTSILISNLANMFMDCPCGTVVVAASDVLLSVPHYVRMKICEEDDSVVGLAVPAPLMTAKNHGVYVVDDNDNDSGSDGGMVEAQSISCFLQKPSVELMRDTPSCTFFEKDQDEECAWIDTGIVAFSPKASRTLRDLCRDLLRCCTERGLKKMISEEEEGHSSVENQTEFASRHALRIELYSHFMLAMMSSKSSFDMEAYLKKHEKDDIPREVLKGIYEMLQKHELKTCAIQEGMFVHLGTSRELVDFLRFGSSDAAASSVEENGLKEKKQHDHYREFYGNFGRTIGLVQRSSSFMMLPPPTSSSSSSMRHENCVILNSIFLYGPYAPYYHHHHDNNNKNNNKNNGEISNGHSNGHHHHHHQKTTRREGSCHIGQGTVMEHCHLKFLPPSTNEESTVQDEIRTGDGCLLSGLRGHITSTTTTKSSSKTNVLLDIPNDMCFQMLPLQQKSSSFVYMYLGVNDPIKSRTKLYNMNIDNLFHHSGLTESDLWDDDNDKKEHLIWNAKIHPIVTADDDNDDDEELKHNDLFVWITYLLRHHHHDVDSNNVVPSLPSNVRASLDRWKNSRRVSLQEIRSLVNVSSEITYRYDLHSDILPNVRSRHVSYICSDVLMKRMDVPCRFDYLLDSTSSSSSSSKEWKGLNEVLDGLDRVIKLSFEKEMYDVTGRTFLVMSSLFADILSCHGNQEEDEEIEGEEMKELDQLVRSSMTLTNHQKNKNNMQCVLNKRDELLHKKKNLQSCIHFCESISCACTELCVSIPPSTTSTTITKTTTPPPKPSPLNSWTIATSPARIDLMGGWSDTPPISYEHGGKVTGMAVSIDGCLPLSSRCRMSRLNNDGSSMMLLRSEARNLDSGELVYEEEVCVKSMDDVRDFRDPNSKCALIKCALICLDVLSLGDVVHGDGNGNISSIVDELGRNIALHSNDKKEEEDDEGSSSSHFLLEITSTSLLPRGSGMGTSSILGGCILSSLATCLGIDILPHHHHSTNNKNSNSKEEEDIIRAVLILEQLLTTGGGWQDQMMGLMGGIKIGSSSQHQIRPLCTSVRRLDSKNERIMMSNLNQRLSLAFTGVPRLAKHVLRNVLRKWGRREGGIVETVDELVDGADRVMELMMSCSDHDDDENVVDEVGKLLSRYWTLKKTMAGGIETGVEPERVRKVLDVLDDKGLISGGSLCGAGGGGFLVVLRKDGVTREDLEKDVLVVDNDFSWHDCEVSEEGLSVSVVVQEGGCDVPFDMSWHRMDRMGVEP